MTSATAPRTLEPGAHLGRLRVVRRLGEGGLAKVYLAEHEVLQSCHAIKLLHVHRPGLVDRLVQEGRIQARLRHPNIVAVTDVVDVGGAVGLVMEYVDGPTLRTHIDEQGALDLSEAVELFGQVLAGVGAAHAEGVLHRDLKPGNVLLASLGGGWLAKVTDFGIAKIVGAEGRRMTRTGVMMGTPGYMAPEQYSDAAHVDERADIFALGVMLYDMLAGVGPFEGGDLYAVLDATVRGRFRPLDELRPDCPDALISLVHDCLAPEAGDRPASCRAIEARLQALPRGVRERALGPLRVTERAGAFREQQVWNAEDTMDLEIVAPEIVPAPTAVPTQAPSRARSAASRGPNTWDPDAEPDMPDPLAAARARAKAAPVRTEPPRTRSSERSLGQAVRQRLALMLPARADGPTVAGPPTESYSRYSMLEPRGYAEGRSLRRRYDAAPAPTGDLLKRGPSRLRRAGLVAAVMFAAALAVVVIGGTWARSEALALTTAEVALHDADAALIGAVERQQGLAARLVAAGAEAEPLEAALEQFRTGSSDAARVQAAQRLVGALRTGFRSLPPAAGSDAAARSAIELELQDLDAAALARSQAVGRRDGLRASPGGQLAQALGWATPSR
ncbi:MAG: protein kinase [Alphaproteobacteria bacterium]|nr:protein kinase [Alphaproteobacteria bacterium]